MLPALLRTALLTVALSAWLPAQALAVGSLKEANSKARAFIQQAMQKQRIPGLQLAVVQNGKVVLLENYGFANVENRVPVTGKTLFPINSATKSFTGVAMMQLVQDGRVDLDAPCHAIWTMCPRPGVGCGSGSCWGIHQAFRRSSTRRGLWRCDGAGGMERGRGSASGGIARRTVLVQPDQLRPAVADHRQVERATIRAIRDAATVRCGGHALYHVR